MEESTSNKRRRLSESAKFYRICFLSQNRNFIPQILQYLHPKDVITHCILVNKTWKKAILESQIWNFYESKYGILSRLAFNPNKILCERRSKGKLYVGLYLGCKEQMNYTSHSKTSTEHISKKTVESHSEIKDRSVNIGADNLENSKKVCIRCIDLSLCNANSDDGVTTSCLRECAYLQKLSHPNIIKYYGAQVTENKIYIVTEYIEWNLNEYIKFVHRESVCKCEDYFKILIFPILKDILKAVEYLHSRNVMHRNIKPENIFVIFEDVENNLSGEIKYTSTKIGDIYMGRLTTYGKGSYTPEESKERSMSFRECRRMQYKAPEILLRSNMYGNEVDLWSVGNIFYELVCNKNLFTGTNEISLVWSIFKTIGFPGYMEVEHLPDNLYDRWSSITRKWNKIEREDVVKALNNIGYEDEMLNYYSKSGQRESFENLLLFCRNIGTTGLYILYGLLNMNGSSRLSAEYILKNEYFLEIGKGECSCFVDSMQPRQNTTSNFINKCLNYHQSDQLLMNLDIVKNVYGLKYSNPADTEIYNLRRYMIPMKDFNISLKDYRGFIVHWYLVVKKAFQLSNETIHFAIGYFLKYIHKEYKNNESEIFIEISVIYHIYISCLKIADRFNEKSQEYYKTNDADEYADFANKTLNMLPHIKAIYQEHYNTKAHGIYEVHKNKIIETEKRILTILNYDLSILTLHFYVHDYGKSMKICPESCMFKDVVFLSNICIHFSELDQFSDSLKAKVIWLISLYRHLSAGYKSEYMESIVDSTRQNNLTDKNFKSQALIPQAQNSDFTKKVRALCMTNPSPYKSKVYEDNLSLIEIQNSLYDISDLIISEVTCIMKKLDENEAIPAKDSLWDITKCIAYIEHFSTYEYEKLLMNGYLSMSSSNSGCHHLGNRYGISIPTKAAIVLLDKSFHEHAIKLGNQSCKQFVQLKV
ncbi:protein kinase domain-containing protein [Theileria equi strain WA]|uniref:Cyclin-dependent kinase 2 homolog n=1 Tax=Theileria equi strain WA TaxID=1537102 RepID=L0B1V5_THEEQ|nr:protein kinase domain-containing protein [Theileria equi strain WA]AFZ81458.1 protein kinase domain-containing protein [Theileria equi strain WA]|eukprot:XP_004831124.1 protein kinase domain-containing protein [Theileria equi strain WA]